MAKSKSRRTKSKAKPAPRSEPKTEAKIETKSETKSEAKVEAAAAMAQTASAQVAKPEIAPAVAGVAASSAAKATSKRAPAGNRRIAWLHVTTVIAATILIGAEVFGAAFAGSWALATLFGLGFLGARILDILLMLCGIAVMVQFVRSAHLIEPFTVRK